MLVRLFISLLLLSAFTSEGSAGLPASVYADMNAGIPDIQCCPTRSTGSGNSRIYAAETGKFNDGSFVVHSKSSASVKNSLSGDACIEGKMLYTPGLQEIVADILQEGTWRAEVFQKADSSPPLLIM